MNQRINDEAVYRTAPATPGLLNIFTAPTRPLVEDGAFSHDINYFTIFKEILNPEGHPNRITGSKVTAILLNGWILPIGGASSGSVCACSLRSRLVYKATHFSLFNHI